MSAAPINGIGHVMLGVRDMARSLAFYRDALGLAVSFGNDEFSFLNAGAVTLCLRHVAELPALDDERRVEIVFSVDDVHAAHQALKGRGVVFRVEPRPVTGNMWATDFRDPDGHVLSIFGPQGQGSRS